MATSDEEPAPAGPYQTPDACEAAFYDAFRTGDLETMEAVWGPAGKIACVHPGRPPLAGRRAVMQSWADILGATGGVRVRFDCHDRVQAGRLAVHTGLEIIGGTEGDPAVVSVTNVYELTDAGWKMRLHHAGPVHDNRTRNRPLH